MLTWCRRAMVLIGLALAAEIGWAANGTIVFFDKNNDQCSVTIPGEGSGLTWQYGFAGVAPRCANKTAVKMQLSQLPSAVKILLSSDPWCEKVQNSDSFWMELRTTVNNTSTESVNLDFISTHEPRKIVRPGMQLLAKYIGSAQKIRDALSCVRVTTSRYATTPAHEAAAVVSESWSADMSESNSAFRCTAGRVLVGRRHSGDENKATAYRCGTASQEGGAVAFRDPETSENIVESAGIYFMCPIGKVMVGREHDHDEEGDTRYICATPVTSAGRAMSVVPDDKGSGELQESQHSFECGANRVMIGRWHSGDENKPTRYLCGSIH